jgi:hypothetical protein
MGTQLNAPTIDVVSASALIIGNTNATSTNLGKTAALQTYLHNSD